MQEFVELGDICVFQENVTPKGCVSQENVTPKGWSIGRIHG